MSLFYAKKLIGKLIMPLGLVFILLVVGLFLAFRRRPSGKWFISAGAAILIALSLTPVSALLSGPLERAYPTLDPMSLPAGLSAVVVLAGGSMEAPDLPPAARLSGGTLKRTLEGIRLWRARPNARLIMASGSWVDGFQPPAKAMAELAVELGVPKSRLVVETVSRDTFENAQQVQKLLGNGPFVVVTSALHMPRTMAIFHNIGLKPIPAPADRALSRVNGPFYWLPNLGALAVSQASIYEYLGFAWYWIRGRI